MKLKSLVDFDLDLTELRSAGEAFETEVSKVISQKADVSNYVKRLEQRHDAAQETSDDIPSPDEMVKELEEFLRSQRQRGQNPETS